MAVIDAEGLYNGRRLRRCSNMARLYWPHVFLAANGFGRFEIDHARIIGRAFLTFNPQPSEPELTGYIREYAENHLLFIYQVNGQLWGQWDTKDKYLPRHKTKFDRESPAPPEAELAEWKRQYRTESNELPKFAESFSALVRGVGVGVGVGVGNKNHVQHTPLHDGVARQIATGTPKLFPVEPKPEATVHTIEKQQLEWFEKWWAIYWRHVARKPAWKAFQRHVKTESRFQQVMLATEQQKPTMVAREPERRPHGATWLNGERWEDEQAEFLRESPETRSQNAGAATSHEETEAERRLREDDMRDRLRASKASA